jgi:CubicO group peptidase (beta-lactamase class C family)
MKQIILLFFGLLFASSASVYSETTFPIEAENSLPAYEDRIKLIDEYLNKLAIERNYSGALLIVKDGKALLNKGYGWADKENKIPFTSGTIASIGSITKAFTSAAILKLEEQGKLSVKDPLKKYFPSIPRDKAEITLHQLLTHSSGFVEFLDEDGGDYEIIKTDAFLKRAFDSKLQFKPGEKAVYTNVGMSILGIIIEQVSGLDYETYLKQHLFSPIGIKNIGYHFPQSPDLTIAAGYKNGNRWGTHQEYFKKAGGGPFWNLKANGGLEASNDEWLIWINAISNNSILSKASTEKMFAPHVLEEGYNGQSSFGYGCNISKSRRGTKLIDNGGSNGIYHARLIRLPEEGLVFYMVTNESSVNTNMVLPNVTQLYFQGKIDQDVLNAKPGFRDALSEKIYNILERPNVKNLGAELEKEGISVEDDMILLEVGNALISESKPEKALLLYHYYTALFPKIVVAWNDMGDVYLSLKNKEAAIECYQQALKIRPENPRAKASLEKLK